MYICLKQGKSGDDILLLLFLEFKVNQVFRYINLIYFQNVRHSGIRTRVLLQTRLLPKFSTQRDSCLVCEKTRVRKFWNYIKLIYCYEKYSPHISISKSEDHAEKLVAITVHKSLRGNNVGRPAPGERHLAPRLHREMRTTKTLPFVT